MIMHLTHCWEPQACQICAKKENVEYILIYTDIFVYVFSNTYLHAYMYITLTHFWESLSIPFQARCSVVRASGLDQACFRTVPKGPSAQI